ncbi:hypothetical protein ACM5Q9_01800 [Advenella sp. RU8]|uniref:hypothetical protein n=1 Tax=Advenella sp. RU8 TaxID=3399575 RepID=UPI003AAFF42A
MAKPIISNTILAVVAVGILFFIGRSVYDVFTRAPVKGIESSQSQNKSSQAGPTVSGTIELPAENNPATTETPANLPAATSKEPASLNQPSLPQKKEPAIANTPSSVPETPKAAAEPFTNAAPTEKTDETSALKTNPDLRQVIPPVPLAPPSPFPTPVNPASNEQLFEATGPLDNNPIDDTPIDSGFPVPQSSFPAPGTTPATIPEPAPFETGEGSPFNNFPAPVTNSNLNSGNVNSSNPEFERLQNLRQQKERLRNDLGF